jgi:hypothetical protein
MNFRIIILPATELPLTPSTLQIKILYAFLIPTAHVLSCAHLGDDLLLKHSSRVFKAIMRSVREQFVLFWNQNIQCFIWTRIYHPKKMVKTITNYETHYTCLFSLSKVEPSSSVLSHHTTNILCSSKMRKQISYPPKGNVKFLSSYIQMSYFCLGIKIKKYTLRTFKCHTFVWA